jgi:hypothetical protein
MIFWGVVCGLLGAGFVAGLYFGILEVNWHIFWLKPGWDNLFRNSWWPTYRHTAFRDIPEPAFATLGVYTLLAKPRVKPVATWRIAVTPVAVIVLTLALGVLGTYLLNFAPWTHNHHVESVLQWQNVGDLVLGFAIGHAMRYLWQPVGATIRGRIMEAPVDRAANAHTVPKWVKRPVAPPVVREQFAKMYSKATAVKGNLYDHNRGRAWLIGGMVFVFVVVTVIGLYGHYWVGAGHHPFLLYPTK